MNNLSSLISICIFSVLVGGAQAQSPAARNSPPASAVAPLVIPEKNRVAAPKGAQLILLLDFFPVKSQLEASPGANDIVSATAKFYAKEYLNKPEYKEVETIVAFIVYVDSMDEYNRANYSGMKRFGTLIYRRDAGDAKLVENKLSFSPQR